MTKMNESFYISHGSPLLAIGDSLSARHFLKSVQQKSFSQKASSILNISGHWETSDPTINAHHDFPNIMYQLKYPAPGAPELVNKVKKLLGEAGFKRVQEDKKRGLDHGEWVPLKPRQISLFANSRSKQIWMQLIITTWDRIWPPLKEEGVLIVCSGNDTHNLSSMQRDNDIVASWALEFDNWLKDSLLNGRCVKYEGKAPFAKQAHLELEHLYPLDVVIDAAGINAKTDLIHHNWTSYTISYASYKFTEST